MIGTVSRNVVVWFVPDPERPWRAQVDGGDTYGCRSVIIHYGRTEFRDEGFTDLPGGPRGVLRAAEATLVDAEIFQTRAAI